MHPMKRHFPHVNLQDGFRAAALLGLLATAAPAAVITWGTPTEIFDDLDVSLNGTLVAAYNFNGSTPPPPVNGVLFQPFAAADPGNQTFTVGNYTLSGNFFTGAGNTGSGLPPFIDLSEPYGALLSTSVSSIANMTLTLGGLTIGQTYEFQTWANNSDVPWHYGVFVSDGVGDAVFLSAGEGEGTQLDPLVLGQYVIGTFTADATTQTILFEPDEVANINGFQLRAVEVIPEPGTFITGALAAGMVGILWLRQRRKAQQAGC